MNLVLRAGVMGRCGIERDGLTGTTLVRWPLPPLFQFSALDFFNSFTPPTGTY
jgi:hypothetical protein